MSSDKPLILCVDDEQNALILRQLVLKKAGFEVVTAASAREALVVVQSRAVDLVLSDHLMPDLTGVELARQIKSQWPQMPVLLLSGVNEVPPGAEIADGFFSKIEGPDKLCQHIHAALHYDAAPSC